MKLSCHSITWGGVVGHPVGVTSIKELFYRANGSTETALRDIAAAGYAGVEVFDGNLRAYEDNPDSFRHLLAETGLQLVAVYSGANFVFLDVLEEELWRIDRAAALAEGFGAEHLVVGGGAQRSTGTTEADYIRLAESLDAVVTIADRHGLQASYHPHLTTIIEGPDQIEKVFERSRINFCPDTAHLRAGGGDPVTLIDRYSDRIVYAHLKDLTLQPFMFQPLGRGEIDVEGVLAALARAGHDGWVTVELDEYDGPPGDAARESKAHIESILARAAAR